MNVGQINWSYVLKWTFFPNRVSRDGWYPKIIKISIWSSMGISHKMAFLRVYRTGDGFFNDPCDMEKATWVYFNDISFIWGSIQYVDTTLFTFMFSKIAIDIKLEIG